MRFLPGILLVVLAIYCWIELAQSDPREVRQANRWLWAALILVPLVGPLGWLIYGRPNGEGGQPVDVRRHDRPVAPDDDPDFLRNIRFDPPGDP